MNIIIFQEFTISETAEHVDIFPSLVDLAGLPQIPRCPDRMDTSGIDSCTEGRSWSNTIKGVQGKNVRKEHGALVQISGHSYAGYTLVTKTFR